MEVKKYRASTMQEALALVRGDLGPGAAVLHTREVGGRLFRWLRRSYVEVTASNSVHVPSRLPERLRTSSAANRSSTNSRAANPNRAAPAKSAAVAATPTRACTATPPAAIEEDYRAKMRANLKAQAETEHSLVEDLSLRTAHDSAKAELPQSWFQVFTDLIEAEISEPVAHELIQQVRQGGRALEAADPQIIQGLIAGMLEEKIATCGPIRTIKNQRRLVALVGPTGVGKTTTIAKLAANFRLREKLRVGLITVDTYRIAAVEQLRTYADIIDLPMEVVSTPREMRAAVSRMADLDLVLLDTAGRSPRDELQIQQLRAMLAEAGPDEVHLVLSSVASTGSLASTTEKFTAVGATALILTKLDEASTLGNLVPLLSRSRLPLSYLTHGQNVPDDIVVADRRRLVSRMLGMEE